MISSTRLAEIWNNSYPKEYAILPESFTSSFFDCELSRPELSIFEPETAILVKESGTPRWFSGQDPKRAHLTALLNPTSATLSATMDNLKGAGFETVVIGMDPDHILPGCPLAFDHLLKVLIKFGFEPGGTYFDTERDLLGYEAPCELNRNDGKFKDCESIALASLEEFFQREFPGRWRHDVMRKVSLDGDLRDVFVFEREGKIHGFAMTQCQTSKRKISGAHWSLALGENWAALGPIGISKDFRGQGLGDQMLGFALNQLQSRGARRTIIDWTTLDHYYGKHGFRKSHQYCSLTYDLRTIRQRLAHSCP